MAVPWIQIVRWAPQIITLSRELLQRSRRMPETTSGQPHTADLVELAQRIAALEDNERRQAELVERMAEQQAQLARALVALHKRQNQLIAAIGVLAAGLALVAWRVLA